MNNLHRIIATIFIISSIYGCGNENSISITKENSISITKSAMSKAFDPINSTKNDIDSWMDKGGLNYNNDFFGVPITNASYGTFIDNKKIQRAELTVSPETSTERMRIAVATACGTTEDKMVREDLPNARTAEYNTRQDERRKLVCYYEATGSMNYILILASSD